MIFNRVASWYGHRNSNDSTAAVVYRCPGDGICDRFTGVAGNTFEEKVEEACASCTKCKGKGPLNPEIIEGLIKDNEFYTESELKDLLFDLEINIIDEWRIGEKLKINDFELWEWESFKYWVKLEKHFETQVQARISMVCDSFLNRK